MSHEIYYTSAPEGLKRGTSGFSTVGASDNIPRALWDRLEALSAYRHHFPASAGASQNPVSHAHWLLNVAGATYHVLSRICDSGVDHTQRTNAFAHHLVVDNGDMTPAGPAWMLQQSGVMQHAWNGQVGPIGSHTLPRGDREPAICRAWEQATGDAGWGGHLADLFIKLPTKPVCILFGPGQDVLPLLAETIALLPPMVRWNVTFNTYFTSMPTSATCVWRCCLAGTPAAQVGLRYASGGVVIDLTDRSRLGQLSAGPYVTMARTGQVPAGVARTVAAPRPAPIKPPPARPSTTAPAAPVAPTVASPVPEPIFETEPAETEPTTIAADPPIRLPEPELPLPLPAAAVTRPPVATRRVTPVIRQADAALKAVEQQASNAAAQRRKQVLILFFGALGAIAMGMVLIYLMRGSSPPDTLMAPPKKMPSETPTAPPPVVTEKQPAPVSVAPTHAPVEIAKAPIPSIPAPQPTPAIQAPIAPTRKYPPVITMTTALAAPVAGGGVADYRQSLTFPAGDLQPLERLPAIAFHFSSGQSDYTTKDNRLKIEAQCRNHNIYFYSLDPASQGHRDEICYALYEQARGKMELHWKTSLFLRQPDTTALTYWLLQSSTIEILANTPTHQVIAFKPWESATIKLSETGTDVNLPMPLPKDAVAAAPAALPAGWKGTWYADWDSKEPTLRKPENASQVIKFEKATSSGAVQSWFLLTFRPGFAKVESTLAKRIAADTSDLATAESDLRALTTSIDEWKRQGVKDNASELQPYLEKQKENAKLVDAYKEALAGYKDLTTIDVPIEMPDGMRLTTLHFAKDKQNP